MNYTTTILKNIYKVVIVYFNNVLKFRRNFYDNHIGGFLWLLINFTHLSNHSRKIIARSVILAIKRETLT